MPSEFFYDLDSIDPKAVAISADEVGRLNPQSGPMRQLDHVMWLSPDNGIAIGVKQVRHDEFWVPHHIPGRPLMPGVLMIEAAAQVSSILYKVKSRENRFLGFTRCDNVVFRGQVVPGETLILLSREKSFRARRFVCEAQGVVNGKLVFEATITGMVL